MTEQSGKNKKLETLFEVVVKCGNEGEAEAVKFELETYGGYTGVEVREVAK